MLLCCSQLSHLCGGAHSFGGLTESPNPFAFPTWWGRGLLFQVWFHSDDMVYSESVMGIKPCDSGVVIGYQVDEFT